MMKRLALAVAGCALTATAAMAQAPLTKVRVAYDGFSMTSAPMIYADKQGIFKKFGLDAAPVFVEGGSTLTQAVVGCVDALSSEMRVVVVGRLLDGLTLETLGGLLRASKDRVWRLERAARRALKTCLEGKGWTATDAVEAVSD